jgi:UDP-N-acetylmuramate-alanine ligase
MKHAVKHIHFVGIGGAGMSGIATKLTKWLKEWYKENYK